MVAVVNIRDLRPGEYAEAWAIVRSPKNVPSWMRHVPELSPSPELFSFAQQQRRNLQWTEAVFRNEFTPRFLAEMREPGPRAALGELVRRSTTDDIAVACFCAYPDKCHRSLVAGLLAGMGADVRADFRIRPIVLEDGC